MSHDGAAKGDAERSAYLQRMGVRMLRVLNDEVIDDRDVIAEWIANEAAKFPGAGDGTSVSRPIALTPALSRREREPYFKTLHLLLLAAMQIVLAIAAVARAENAAAVENAFPNTACFRGRVVDEQNRPVSGVKVWPHGFQGKLALPEHTSIAKAFAEVSRLTDDDGAFSIPLRFAGKELSIRNVQVSGRGYVQVMDGRKHHLGPGKDAVVEYRLEPGEVLSGVIDPLIGGVVDAVFHPDKEFMEVLNVRGETFDQTMFSEIGGAFEVYVPPGQYCLSVGNVELENIQSGTTGIRIRRPSPAVSAAQCRAAVEALRADMDRNYSYFVLKRDIDWNNLCAECLKKVDRCETQDELLFAIISLLRQLNDKHIWVEADGARLPTCMHGWTRNWNETVVVGQLAESRTIGAFAQVGTTRRSGFGYLAIFDLSATERETTELLTEMRRRADAPAFVVDLRRCSGGSEPLAEQIAQFFCDREVVYAKNKYRDGARHEDFGPDLARTLSPSSAPYRKPVVCLIGNRTMSSAESFAQMLDVLPRTVTVGSRTRGSSGNPAPFALPDTAVKIWYSRWFDMDAGGAVVEGRGIAPDVLVDEPIDAFRDGDPVFSKALAELAWRFNTTAPEPQRH